MEKQLTIIIPTYNMEQYIRKCLDSLLIPEIDQIEVLVVNDGSKDKSSEIAHRYSDRYPDSIKVIDKPNGNYGSCINAAIPVAKGRYVKILDADDTFDTEAFSKMVKFLANCNDDCIITNYVGVDPDGKPLPHQTHLYEGISPNTTYTFAEVSNELVEDGAMHALAIKTNIIRNIGYTQSEGISYTDMEWIYSPIAYCKTFIHFPQIVYKYLNGREGQTVDARVMLNRVDNILIGLQKQIDLLEELKDVTPEGKIYLKRMLAKRLMRTYRLVLSHPESSQELLTDFDKKNKSTLKRQGVDLECISKLPILNTSYIKTWRKGNYKKGFSINWLPLHYFPNIHRIRKFTSLIKEPYFKVK